MNKEKKARNAEKKPQEEKIRRKDAKMIDNVLKGMENVGEPEKFETLIRKYTELYEDYRNSQNALNAEQKTSAALQQQKEHLNLENNKLELIRNRLEKLSREFQRQNKILKEENLVKIRDEEERRRQITVEFQKALYNVTTMMAESNEQNNKLGEENKNMAKRLSNIYEDVKNRQTEVDRFSRQIDIERQLAETRFAKVSTEFMIEKEKLCAEKEILKKRCEHLTLELRGSLEKSISLEKTITELRGQLNGYTGRYEEFQKAINKSSKIFDQCKSEISGMNDQIFNQKKELLEWQAKNQRNLATIRELNIQNEQKGMFIDQVNKKQSQLAKLCRRLQAERSAYINALRNNGHNPDDFVANLTIEEHDLEVDINSSNIQLQQVLEFKPAPIKVEKDKNKRGKQKNKDKVKGTEKIEKLTEIQNELLKFKLSACDDHQLPVINKDPLVVKELHLAELKEELKKIQYEVDKIKTPDNMEKADLMQNEELATVVESLEDTTKEVDEIQTVEISQLGNCSEVEDIQSNQMKIDKESDEVKKIEEDSCQPKENEENNLQNEGTQLEEKDDKTTFPVLL